mmetsp:Transcript_95487/g.154023  ORF Transcript_95487/g.154023 Transcript_95487/m.154023 type:complete len:126 (+) Transcript_95487:356-733(+)
MYCMEYHFYLLDEIYRSSGILAGYVKTLDLAGVKMSQLSWVRKWQQSSVARKERLSCDVMECYPECFSKVAVVNWPSFFATIWKIIKPFVPARTVEKACTEIIEEAVLPVFLGGSWEGEWRMRPL